MGMPSRRSVPAIFPVSTVWPAQSRQSSTIWNAIPSASPNSPSSGRRLDEEAGGFEELRRLQGAAGEVLVDRGVRTAPLGAFQALAADEPERCIGEDRNGLPVSGRCELGEGAREQVDAAGSRGIGAVRRPDRGAPAPQLGAVDQVVVNEARHVHELDRDSRGDGALGLGVRGQEDEQRAHALPARGERLDADLRDEPGSGADGHGETVFELVQVRVEPGRGADGGERAHRATPVCRATIPPANFRQRISPKPASSMSWASPCGSGKRRTLAGRYV